MYFVKGPGYEVVVSHINWEYTKYGSTHVASCWALQVNIFLNSFRISEKMHAACDRLGVEVCLTQEDLSQAPCCPHGKSVYPE